MTLLCSLSPRVASRVLACALACAFALGPLPAAHAAGQVDTDFGNNGGFALQPSPELDVGNQLFDITPDLSGGLTAVGQVPGPANTYDAIVLRLTRHGVLDESFGDGGRVDLSPLPNNNVLSAIAVSEQTNGKLVVLSTLQPTYGVTSQRRPYICRLNADGSIDDDYAIGGCRVLIIDPASEDELPVALVTDGLDRAVVVVASRDPDSGNPRLGVARLTDDGELDPCLRNLFCESDGTKIYLFPDQVSMHPRAAVLWDDNHIVIGGDMVSDGTPAFFVTWLTSLGAIDGAFGDGGLARIPAAGPNMHDIAVQGDGDIVAVGVLGPQDARDVAVMRWHSDGKSDLGFGNAGLVVTHFGALYTHHVARGVAIQPDDRIVVAGEVSGGGLAPAAAALRLNPDGSLDPQFASNGRGVYLQRTPSGATAMDSDVFAATAAHGRVYLAGSAGTQNQTTHFQAVLALGQHDVFRDGFESD